MRVKNTENRFGFIAIFLHWIMAVLIVGMLTIGLYMVGLPDGPDKSKLYGWHKEFGYVVLSLVTLRLAWRLMNKTPDLSIPLWEKLAARATHWALYICMFAMPITGWLVSSAAGYPASFFGLFTVPSLIAPNEAALDVFATAHQYIAYTLIGLIILHLLAALKHHFIDKDDILRRMFS